MNPEIIEQYKKLNWSDLLRKELGDAGRLDEAKDTLDRIKVFLDRLVDSPVTETLSPQALSEIGNKISSFTSFTQTILTYSDVAQKPQVIQQIKNYEYEILTSLGKYSAYLDSIGLRDNSEEQSRIERLRTQERELEQTLDTVKSLAERAKKVAQGEEAKSFGNAFDTQANLHKDNANVNFWLMIGSSVLTVLTAILLLKGEQREFNLEQDLSSWQNFLKFVSEQNILLYIIVFSLLSFLISHFSRNFSSEKNLENVYRQKQKALDSHQQIIKSVQGTESDNDLETQNALLAYMAKAIFETKETGYLKGVHHNTSPSGPILDMTKKN
jgi:hypothetical protein